VKERITHFMVMKAEKTLIKVVIDTYEREYDGTVESGRGDTGN
jgi:hypothetical protein